MGMGTGLVCNDYPSSGNNLSARHRFDRVFRGSRWGSKALQRSVVNSPGVHNHLGFRLFPQSSESDQAWACVVNVVRKVCKAAYILTRQSSKDAAFCAQLGSIYCLTRKSVA
jgi:hypothetical protein